MRTARSLCLLLVVLTAAPAFAENIAGLTSKKLKNGLDVIVLENHAVPLVTVEIAVRSGGFVETPDYAGLSHLYEHMFFKANRAIPNQEAYLKRLRELGAVWNGSTGTERVNYYLTLPSENMREGAVFLRDALYGPLFQQKELERERVVVLGEVDRAEAQPGYLLAREVERKLWYQYFSRKNVLGDREVIATTPREKMITLKERYYVPNNSALLFSGDVNPDEAYALAEELFGDWKATEDPHKLYPEPAHPPLKESSTFAVIAPVKTTMIEISWHGPSMTGDTPSTFAADTLSYILMQPTSRFYKNLVDSGLFDRVSLTYLSNDHTGPITAFGVTTPERLDRAHAALLDEIEHFADGGYFSDNELAFAKSQLEVSEIYGRERAADFVHTLSFWWASGGIDYYPHYLDNLRKVSRADIQNYVRRYIAGKPSVTGILVSEENAGKIALLANAEKIHPVKGSSATAMKPQAAQSQTEAFDVDGVRVVLRTNANSPVVAARAFLQGGLAYAGPQRAGLESLMLEVASKQSAKYPKEKMAEELTRLGATIDVIPSPDYSIFALTALRRSFDDSMRIFADALVHPLFTDSEVALARERRLTELQQEQESPDAFLNRTALENAYGTHPYAADPLGTAEIIKAANAKQLRDLHASTVSRSRLLLVIVGNVTRTDVEGLLSTPLKDLPAGDFRPLQAIAIPNADRVTSKIVTRDLPTVYVTGLFRAPNRGSADDAAMTLSMSILSHRLFEEIRTKRNLSYAPFSRLQRSAYTLGQVYVTTANPNASLKVMRDEIEKMRTTPVSESELKDQAGQYKTSVLTSMQASADIAQALGDWELTGGGWQNFDAFLQKIDDVTPEQVRAAMNRYAHGIDFTVVGKVADLDTKLLESF